MGGKNEDTIKVEESKGGTLDPQQKPAEKPSIPTVAPLSQKIRYHEKDGNVHFHLDDEGLKVNVPVADWWGAWEQLKNLRVTEWKYIDHKRGTMLKVTAGLDSSGNFEVCPTVTQLSQGAGGIFQKLDDFTSKCGK
jgi:hypothetical protein